MNSKQLEAKIHEMVEYFHTYDLDGLIGMFADNAVVLNFTNEERIGHQAIRDLLTPYFNKEFGEMHFDLGRFDADESTQTVWQQWTMSLTGPDTVSTFQGVDTFEFKDGLVVRNSVFVKSVEPLTSVAPIEVR